MTRPRPVVRWIIAAAVACTPSSAGLTAAGTDATAGNWRMIVLTGPTQFAVAAPAQVSGLEYQAELTAITNDQRKAIQYWSRGGVLRWNEIMLGLVSRFNLPPAPNADGRSTLAASPEMPAPMTATS